MGKIIAALFVIAVVTIAIIRRNKIKKTSTGKGITSDTFKDEKGNETDKVQ